MNKLLFTEEPESEDRVQMKDMKDFNKEIIVKPRIRPIRPHIKIKPHIDNNFIKSLFEFDTFKP